MDSAVVLPTAIWPKNATSCETDWRYSDSRLSAASRRAARAVRTPYQLTFEFGPTRPGPAPLPRDWSDPDGCRQGAQGPPLLSDVLRVRKSVGRAENGQEFLCVGEAWNKFSTLVARDCAAINANRARQLSLGHLPLA